MVAALVLLAGLGGGVLIYLTSDDASDSVLGYEVMGGTAYPIRPEDSKAYRHDLELYGGKANLLVNDFMRWFDGLWHGRSLAVTVGCIAIFAALAFFLIARHLPPGSEPDVHKE